MAARSLFSAEDPVRYLVVCNSVLVMLLAAVAARGAAPVASNVHLQQRTDGSGLVDITYDLADADSPSLAVAVQMSANDGASWDFPVLNMTGDLGMGVAPGIGKRIVWNLGVLPLDLNLEQFRARIVASDTGILHAPHSPRNVAITDWSAINWSLPANLEKYARADVFVAMSAALWSSQYRDVPIIDGMKAINPDLKVIGYISAKSAQLSGVSPSANAFWHAWYDATRPYWVYTTTGDTAQDWPGNVILNILNPACRTAMIETVMEFQRTSANKLDGIMWDYFNTALWVYPGITTVTGAPDMDGDGIAHSSDPDEMAAYRNAEVSLVSALRDSLGEGFIQFFNGQRAYSDSTFAGLADGLMYELFPTMLFPQPNMRNALNPAFVHNLYAVRGRLRDVNGGPWIVMFNPWINRYNDENEDVVLLVLGNQFRVVAMLMDGYASWNSKDGSTFSYSYDWTDNDICVGEPTGPPIYDGNFIRRDFQYGRVELEWKSGSYPDPFKYKVWSLGQLVEQLALPVHFP
jgi:hypothetical protein